MAGTRTRLVSLVRNSCQLSLRYRDDWIHLDHGTVKVINVLTGFILIYKEFFKINLKMPTYSTSLTKKSKYNPSYFFVFGKR